MIDLMNIEPHEVASNINGYAIGVYGDPGVGKTTLASKINKSLLVAVEPGYKALPGVKAVDAHSWVDVLTINSQLKRPEVREAYDVVVIDTLDELVFVAEQYVLQSHGVKKLNDIPWGGGYVELSDMFKKLFRDITKNYGLVVIAHADLKVDPEDEENRYATLGFNKKVKKIVMGLLDVLTYVESSRDPDKPSMMHFRSSKSWEAKARFANIVSETEFSYDNLVKAIQDAVQGVATKEEHKDYYSEEELEMSEEELEKLKNETTALARKKVQEDESRAQSIMTLADNTIGKTVADCKMSDAKALKVFKEELERL